MRKIKNVIINRKGQIRSVWLMLAAVMLYFAAAVGVYRLYWHLYETMMRIWGVTAQNIVRAPAAVRFLYQWSNVIVQLIQSALLIGSTALLGRMTKKNPTAKSGALKEFGMGAAIGAACVLLMWCVLMILGSVRLGWRFTRPHFSVNTFALFLTTLGAAAGEGLFFYRGLYGGMKQRLPARAALYVMMAVNVGLVLSSGMIHPIRLINSGLSAMVCALLAEYIGIGATVGLRWGWSYLDQAVFGFAGAQAALYETYPVNMYWLCGGNGGLMNGVLTTLVLGGLAAWLMKRFSHQTDKA